AAQGSACAPGVALAQAPRPPGIPARAAVERGRRDAARRARSGRRLAPDARSRRCRRPDRARRGRARVPGRRRGPSAALLRTKNASSPAAVERRHNRTMAKEITPREASHRVARGAVLVDVREDHERELGMAQGAIGVPRAELEAAPHVYLPGQDADIVLICQSGGRSMLAADQLLRLGYQHVSSVRGGTAMWQAEGLPLTRPDVAVDEDFHERYSRHLRLPEIGARGQRRL